MHAFAVRARLTGTGSFLVSLGFHGLLLGAGAWLVGRTVGGGTAGDASLVDRDVVVESFERIDLPKMAVDEGADIDDGKDTLRVPAPRPGGTEAMPRPDMDHAGRGGTRSASAPAVNLADHDDGLTLTREVESRIDRDQVQRVASARDRAAREDRPATSEPMTLTFFASGEGTRREARIPAKLDPSAGVEAHASAASKGMAQASTVRARGEADPLSDAGRQVRGVSRPSPGQGVLDGEPGDDHRASAFVAHGQPMIVLAVPSVPAATTGDVRDDRNSEQEVHETVTTIIHASTAGGERGIGTGGEPGAALPGSGGPLGEGSRAAPLGAGGGPLFALSSGDPRLSPYTRAMLAKLDREPLWQRAFPHEAALEGMQGVAVLSILVRRDGSVGDVSLARPSGIPAFDANVRAAVLHAAPFAPLPVSWNAASARVRISYDATNPAVR